MLNIRDFGAVPDGKTLNTKAIQAAIDACAAQGGGMVTVPAGLYVTGTIWLKSNVELHVEMGATLWGSDNLDDYCAVPDFPQNHQSKNEQWNGAHLIVAVEQDNVALTGPGTIDGRGEYFFEETVPPHVQRYFWADGMKKARDKERLRPGQMCFFCECTNVRVTDLTLVNSTCWTVLLYGCNNAIVRGLRIENTMVNGNTDGIDIDICDCVTVSDCIIKTGDDAITLRGNPSYAKDKTRICQNVTIMNCVLECSVCGFRIGVGDGVIRNAAISNIVFKHLATGFLFQSAYTAPSVGTTISDIAISNIQMMRVAYPLKITSGAESATSVIHDVNINGMYGECYGGCQLTGSTLTQPNHIRVRNVDLKVTHAPVRLPEEALPRNFFTCSHVKDVVLDNVEIRWADADDNWRKAIAMEDCDVTVLPNCSLPEPPLA